MVLKFILAPNLAPEDTKVFMEHTTVEMRTWLDDNIEAKNYFIAENRIRIKHVFMPTATNKNEYQIDGYYVLFDNAEDAMAFKLRWTE